MKAILLFLIILLPFAAKPQAVGPEIITFSGDYFKNTNISLGITLGEPVIETLPESIIVLTQGFQQPDYISIGVNGSTEVNNLTVLNHETLCFDATYSIIVENMTIKAGGDVRFVAGYRILFLPGILIEEGASMLAQITTTGEYCINDRSLLAVDFFDLQPEQLTNDDALSITEWWVYPNPCKGHFNVEFTDYSESHGTIEVYSIAGKFIRQQAMTNNRLYEFNISDCPRGIYFVRLVNGKGLENKKIILQ